MKKLVLATAIALGAVAGFGGSYMAGPAEDSQAKNVELEEGQFAYDLVNRTDISITEEFQVTEVFKNAIRAEKTRGSGEGVYYTKKQFKKFGAPNLKLGDKIRVSWKAKNYWNEDWDKVEYVLITKRAK